jgi:hypothetical protein
VNRFNGLATSTTTPSWPPTRNSPLEPDHSLIRVTPLFLRKQRCPSYPILAIGIVSLLLINGPVRHGSELARIAVVLLIGIAEGNNACRMYPFASASYGPLSFAILAIVGAALVGNRRIGHKTVDATKASG